jgi:hypothetical protein
VAPRLGCPSDGQTPQAPFLLVAHTLGGAVLVLPLSTPLQRRLHVKPASPLQVGSRHVETRRPCGTPSASPVQPQRVHCRSSATTGSETQQRGASDPSGTLCASPPTAALSLTSAISQQIASLDFQDHLSPWPIWHLLSDWHSSRPLQPGSRPGCHYGYSVSSVGLRRGILVDLGGTAERQPTAKHLSVVRTAGRDRLVCRSSA